MESRLLGVALFTICSGIGVFGSQPAQALSCPISTTVSLSTADTNSISCQITETGQLDILSSGSLENLQTGSILNDNILNNSGTLTNRGTLTNFASLNNAGTLTGSLGNLGTLTNTGTLNSKTLTNTGQINNYSALQLSVGTSDNHGTLTNHTGGILTNSSGGTLLNNNFLINDGTLISETFTVFRNQATGTIINNGSLTNSGQMLNHNTLENNGTWTNNNRLELNNGTFTNNAELINYATQFNVNSSGTLLNNGTFTNNSRVGIDGQLISDGTFDNHGELEININSGAAGRFDNLGVLNNSGTITLFSTNIGIQNTGTINNSGKLDIGEGTQVSGSGTISQTAGSTVVDGSLDAASVTFTGGTLGGHGVVTSSGVPVNIDAGATINPGDNVASNPIAFTGELTIGSDLDFDGALTIEIAELTDFDILSVLGAADFGLNSLITFDLEGYIPSIGDSIDFLIADSLTGFNNISYDILGLSSGLTFDVLLTPDSDLRLTFAAVPIPAGIWLFSSGLIGLISMAKRRTQP